MKPKKPKKPRIKNVALYRLSLTAKIGKDACIGIRIPEGVKKDDWIKYQMFCCFEELAMYLDGKEQE